MKIVYHAGNIAEAHIVRGLLEANGVTAHIGGHYLQGGIGELPAMDTAIVQVDEAEYDTARAIVAKYDSQPADTDTQLNTIDKKAVRRMNAFFGSIIIALVIGWLIITLSRA